MKKYISIFISLAIYLTSYGNIYPESLSAADHQDSKKPSIHSNSQSWKAYSNGLYYKNLALEDLQSEKSSDYLKKAVEYFKEALTYNEETDRVLYQLSDCYYFLYDFNNSLDYAYQSIAVNKKDIKPYNRLYNIFMRLRNYEKAAEVLEQYILVDPEYVYVHHLLAEHYLKYMKDSEKAIAAFKNVITVSDKNAVEDFYKENALYNLGHLYYIQGDTENGISYLKHCLEINKSNIKAIYLLTLIYMDTYQLENALKYAELFNKSYPDNTKIYSILGRIYYIKNNPRAMSYLRIAGKSKSLDGILALAFYNEMLHHDDLAEKVLNSAVKFKSDMIEIHLALADINKRKQDLDSAFNEYLTAGILLYRNKRYVESTMILQKAMKLNKDIAGIYYYLGRTYEDSDSVSRAILNFKKANEIKPSNDLLLHIGYLYGVRGDYDKAIEHFMKVTENEPENSKPYFFTGLVSIWQKNYAEAEINIKKAISLTDNNETYYFYLAIVMEKLDRFNEAVSSLELAIKHNPQSARAYNYLGYLYADRGINIEESHSLILKALELEPDNGAYIDSLGWVYFRKGDYDNALKKLIQAMHILDTSNTPDPVVFDHIGDTYQKLGNIPKALQYWNKSLEYKKDELIQKKIDKHSAK